MEGKGIHVCAEGSRYEGQLRANYRHGHGRCQWGNRHDTPFRFGEIARVLSRFFRKNGRCDYFVFAQLIFPPGVMG